MRHFLLAILAFVAITPSLYAGNKNPKEAPKEDNEIHWITIDELQAKMKQEPKKVFFDVYTGWCGWCKKMEATTFHNAALVKYMNNNFYAVRLDAETQKDINFLDKPYHYEANYKANTFAIELLQGKMSYPTSVLMLENFQSPTPIPGYHDVKEMESFLRYFGDNVYKHQKWEDYQKGFISSWDHVETPTAPNPAGH